MKRAFPRLAWMLLACGLAACSPNVEPCDDDCPDIGGTRAAGTGGGGATGGTEDGGKGGGGSNATDSGMDATTPEAGSASPDAGRDGGAGTAGGSDAGAGAGAGTGGEGGAGGTDSGTAGTDAGTGCGACPAERPVCDGDECVECYQDQHCSSGVCVNHACVDCRDQDQCISPAAPHCAAYHCVSCVANANCTHIEGKPICSDGTCVECDGSQYSECGTNGSAEQLVCNSLGKECTSFPEHSAGLCEPCVSDAQCGVGQLCVMQTYDDPDDSPDLGEIDVGYYCFWREDSSEASAPEGDCVNARPYVDTHSNADSIDGAHATICELRVTTCTGYKDYSTKECSDTSDDGTCGDGRFEGDGSCEQLSSSTYVCTTPCGGDYDCKPGFSCNTAVTPNYCNLQ